MALPTIIAANQTAGALLLTRLGLTVPASSTLTLTDYARREEIWGDESLYAFVLAGDIFLDLGGGPLPAAESLKYWNLIPFQPITVAVRAVRDTNLASLSGTTTADSVALAAGDRVLLTAQSTGTENGPWVVQAGAWVRPDDFGVGQAASKVLVAVGSEGTLYANQVWTCVSTAGSDVIGTDNLSFEVAAGGTTLQEAYVAGNTITTSAGEGNITFTGTEDFVLTVADFSATLTGTIGLDAAGTISIGAAANTGAINIGTGAAARTLTVGNATGATAVNVDTGTGGFDVDSLGVVSIGGTDTTDLTMTANSGASKTLSLAATNAGAGTGNISITADDAVALASTAGTIDLQAAGNLTIDSSGGSIGIGTDADTGAINIGTAAAARTISIGNSTGATALNLTAGTGNILVTAATTTITGNLVVQGTTTTVQSETVNIADNHLYMNDGYTTAAAVTGGLVVNYLPTATADTVAAGGFTAGVPATSNPTVATAGAATFSAGDLIQVSGATNQANDGLYEVLSHAANVLTIRGIGTTATVEDFTQNQFVASAGAVGAITKVTVSVIRAGTDGIWETASGSTTGLTFVNLLTATTTTLQQAYVGGNTITVTAGEGPLAITLTSDDFTVNGANDVDFGGSTALSTFNVDATGAITVDGAGISIDGTAASNFSVTGAGLTLATITSGTLTLSSAGAWNASGTTMDVQASGAVTIDSSGSTIGIGTDANNGAINIGTAAAARTLTIGNNTGTTAVVVNSGTEQVQIDGVTYYGNSAGNPTARAGGFQDGDHYYDTALDMEMRYDSGRAKWLSVEAAYFYFGRNGNLPAGTYYRGPDSLVMSATSGFHAPYNGTIVGLGYTRSDSAAATFEVVEGGTSRATLASSATSGRSNALNGDFSQGGILAALNQAGGNTTSDVNAWVKFKWRAT